MGFYNLQMASVAKIIIFAMRISIVSFLLALPVAGHAVDIIVNSSVPATPYTMSDVRAIFAMQQRFWPNGEQIKVFTLADNDPVHKDFMKVKLDMFPHQLRRVWDRMAYSGTGETPVQVDSEAEMVERIANTPNSIGYLNSRSEHENIRLFEYQ